MAYTEEELKKELEIKEYEYGFYTDIDSDTFPVGLNEDIVRAISKRKEEPQWMTDWRLDAYRSWVDMVEPEWHKLAGVAVDIVVDSVSVATTFRDTLAEKGIIFCSISEAIKEYPDLVKKYIGTVVPVKDNFYAALNSAVFSDGSFCYIPKGVRCPMELSTYFRINQAGTGQFERTLVVADESSYVSYLEGCTAPSRDENQLHAAVVELVAMDDAEIKYSTVQNWFPGDKDGKGGDFNFVTMGEDQIF